MSLYDYGYRGRRSPEELRKVTSVRLAPSEVELLRKAGDLVKGESYYGDPPPLSARDFMRQAALFVARSILGETPTHEAAGFEARLAEARKAAPVPETCSKCSGPLTLGKSLKGKLCRGCGCLPRECDCQPLLLEAASRSTADAGVARSTATSSAKRTKKAKGARS